MLRADEVDLAVGSMLEVPDDVTYRPVVTFNPALITPAGHPLANKTDVSLAEIAEHGLILPPRHLSTWRMVDLMFSQQGLDYKVTLEAGGWEVIKKYVELGLGISIVTDLCLTGDERLGRVPLERYFPKRSYGIVLRRGKFLSPQTKRFQEIMALVYPDDAVDQLGRQRRGEGGLGDGLMG
jgi:DNA-binding transcriptional LysR family regulator